MASMVVLLVATSSARAESIEAVHATAPETLHLALAVNPPFGWPDGNALGLSLFAGVTDHQALRANVATYANHASGAVDLLMALSGGDGDEGLYHGRTTDIGVGWMYFPRHTLDGFSVELGALYRSRDVSVQDENAPTYYVGTDTQTLAARGLVGWSWLFSRRVFLSVQAGISVGRESGTETRQASELDMMRTTRDVARLDIAPEGFMRLGVAFDL